MPGTPKGTVKGKKPPAITTEAASADINHRSPLNLIRKWEKNDPAPADSTPGALAAKVGSEAGIKQWKAGSSAEEESADGASASGSSTPCTPAGGYEAVLASVREEIMQAEKVMSTVTSTFGVDRFLLLSLSLLSLTLPPPSLRSFVSLCAALPQCQWALIAMHDE